MSRAFKIAISISLGLNVIFIGAVAGFFLHHRPFYDMVRRTQEELVNNLPKEKRQELQPLLEKTLSAEKASLDHLRDMQGKIQTLLASEAFNSAEFSAALDQVEKERAALGGALADLFKAVASAQDQDARKKFSRWFAHMEFPGPPPPPPPPFHRGECP